jgi:hypothetical protein
MEDWEAALATHEAERRAMAAVTPNPPCRPWCTNSHDPDEWVMSEGWLHCGTDLAQGEKWGLALTGPRQAVDDEDLGGTPIYDHPMAVHVDLLLLDNEVPVDQLDVFIAGLQSAREAVRGYEL